MTIAAVIRVKPQEAIYMTMLNKAPGLDYVVKDTKLDMSYDVSSSKAKRSPEAYERLFHDILMRNQQSFLRNDELDVEETSGAFLP